MSENSTKLTDWHKLKFASTEKVGPDKNFRYEMWVSPTDNPRNPLIAIGLNPCGKTDDENFSRTTDNLRKIAFNNHYDGLIILNLCPIITEKASDLASEKMELKDIAHQENLKHIRNIAERYKDSDVLLCFGKAIVKQCLTGYFKNICDALSGTNENRRFLRLDATRHNKPYANPPHPSRISPMAALIPMDIAEYCYKLRGA